MTITHYAWCTLFVCALPGCQPGVIGEAPGTPDSGSTSDAPAPAPDAYQPPIADAAPPDAPAPIPDAPAPPPCIQGDDQVLDPDTGHCYMAYYTQVNWEVAQAWCDDVGGHLVDVTSSAENDIALALAGGLDNWMGGNDRLQEGAWVWLNGAALSYTNWRSGEPNNSTGTDTVNGEDCGVIEGTRGGTWDDRPCTLRTYNFICERE